MRKSNWIMFPKWGEHKKYVSCHHLATDTAPVSCGFLVEFLGFFLKTCASKSNWITYFSPNRLGLQWVEKKHVKPPPKKNSEHVCSKQKKGLPLFFFLPRYQGKSSTCGNFPGGNFQTLRFPALVAQQRYTPQVSQISHL